MNRTSSLVADRLDRATLLSNQGTHLILGNREFKGNILVVESENQMHGGADVIKLTRDRDETFFLNVLIQDFDLGVRFLLN